MEEIQRRGSGVIAEYALIGASSMDQACPYDVIIDRISHEVPYYRTYLKKAVLDGVTVVNNPFMWSADDKFFGATLATKLGVASPKTLALPNKSYVPGIVASEPPQPGVSARLAGDRDARGDALHPQGRLRRRLEGGLRLPLPGGAAPSLRQLRTPHHGGSGIHPVGAVRAVSLPGPGRDPGDALRSARAAVSGGSEPPSLTLGVEEEYQIIDPATRELTSYITQILQADHRFLEQVKPELHQSIVEVGTKVCRTPAEVRTELVNLRGAVIELAARNGLKIAAAGTHPSPPGSRRRSHHWSVTWV
jgi:hypothetical protein